MDTKNIFFNVYYKSNVEPSASLETEINSINGKVSGTLACLTAKV